MSIEAAIRSEARAALTELGTQVLVPIVRDAMATEKPRPLVVTRATAAGMLGTSADHITELVEAGELSWFDDRKTRRVAVADLEAYVSRTVRDLRAVAS